MDAKQQLIASIIDGTFEGEFDDLDLSNAQFPPDITIAENTLLRDMNFEGATLTGTYLADCTITNSNFNGATLTSVHLENTSLEGGTTLVGTIVNGIFLTEGSIDSDLVGLQFVDNATLIKITLANINITNTNFTGADLTDATFQESTLTNTDFIDATLITTNFENATLIKTDFTDARLRGAYLKNTKCIRAKFIRAKLQSAQLIGGTELMGADFTGADLTSATIENANLQYAEFTDAILTDVFFRGGVDLTRAFFHRTILSHTETNTQVDFRESTMNYTMFVECDLRTCIINESALDTAVFIKCKLPPNLVKRMCVNAIKERGQTVASLQDISRMQLSTSQLQQYYTVGINLPPICSASAPQSPPSPSTPASGSGSDSGSGSFSGGYYRRKNKKSRIFKFKKTTSKNKKRKTKNTMKNRFTKM